MTVKQLEKKSRIGKQEFENISKIIYSSFNLDKKISEIENFQQREEMILDLSSFLKKILDSKYIESKKHKLELIDFIDKLNVMKEMLEIAKGEVKMSDVKKAGNRLGKKAQSAFKGK